MENNESNRNDSLKEIHTTFDSDGSVKESSKKGGVFPKIMSVIAAIALWLYVFQAVEYEKTFNDIPIEIEEDFDSDSGLGIVNNYPLTVDVTISGTKSNIDKISADNISAYVDINNVYRADTYTCDVKIDVPSNVEVTHQSIEQLRIEIDKTVEKRIDDITVKPNYVKQLPFELGDVELMDTDRNPLNEIVLTGPETDLMNIKRADINLELGNVKNTVDSNINTKTAIALYDAAGNEIDAKYITIHPASISVHIPVYKSKQVAIVPNLVIDNNKFEYKVHEEKAEIFGLVNDIDNISSIETVKTDISSEGGYILALEDLGENVAVYKIGSDRKVPVTSVSLSVTEVEAPVNVTAENANLAHSENGNAAASEENEASDSEKKASAEE